MVITAGDFNFRLAKQRTRAPTAPGAAAGGGGNYHLGGTAERTNGTALSTSNGTTVADGKVEDHAIPASWSAGFRPRPGLDGDSMFDPDVGDANLEYASLNPFGIE